MKEFTREELEKYNGKDGNPAFVVKDGKVFDVTASGMWAGGAHMGRHSAGADLTADFAQAPHGEEVLARVKQVGVLAENNAQTPAGAASPAGTPVKAPSPSQVPGWAKSLLGFHPHPIVVHFPQAAFSFAPMFLVLAYFFKSPFFERTAFYMLICGVLTVVPAFVTGLFHWVYKYAMAGGGVYKFKLFMSQVLIILSLVTALLHNSAGMLDLNSINTTILTLYLLLVPVAATLGHAGGIIVFGPHKK